MIPYQDAFTLKINKTKDLEKFPTDLLVMPLAKN